MASSARLRYGLLVGIAALGGTIPGLVTGRSAAPLADTASLAPAHGAVRAMVLEHLTGGALTAAPAAAPAAAPVAAPAAAAAAAPTAVEAQSARLAAAPSAALRQVTAPPPPAPPPPPVRHRGWLSSADGSLNVGVGVYSDCSGRTPLTHAAAAIDTCVGGRTYFVGHNPGVFTPLMHMGPGSVITWWDGAGTPHRLIVVAVRTWLGAAGAPPPVSGAVTVQFQTCQVSDGSVDRILDAVAA